MASQSVVTMEKPMAHISLTDWNARVARLCNVADARCADTFTIRNTSRTLINETRIESTWANKESNVALTDRIDELEFWRKIIAKTFERLENEIESLKQEKIKTERLLDTLGAPIALIGETLSKRDCRLGAELTYDEPDTEIKNELYVLENNQRLLSDRCRNAWEKLIRLQDVSEKIRMEIEGKVEAKNTDSKQLALDRSSTKISYKPDSQRIPQNACTYEAWLENAKNIKQLAENELADTAVIRESLFVCREKARSILNAQQERTEYSLRKRIFETKRARNELEWQKVKMKEEMERAVCSMDNLEAVLQEKSADLKLAETRLENRALRRGRELCLDYAQAILHQEVEKLREMQRCLREKLEESQANYNLLTSHAQKVDLDLENKSQSLNADTRALELRLRLKEEEIGMTAFNPSAHTDRNIELLHMENIPK
ncbi:tektin-B1-like isoform X1 [Drosophila sulfurigaster albostrigata]|uniref:tektin-B1-like isoform X1 n=1 Tax=Drosophila sulfurigaster albostrigata TaxID=89887 RepID=UPI002D21989F|nr:tektin-B1-like isoform X1 [Drosophila sulfurigaster albostrigata]